MISARQIADALDQPSPTLEQQAVIEAEPTEPALVVAGAGSGKTETMSNRVLWLLANGHVGARDVLGLTFTRKAASELGARIRRRIAQLIRSGLAEIDFDPFDPPTTTTYNAFAHSLYHEFAALLGHEADAMVLSEASAWQLARSLVVRSRDPRLVEMDRSVESVTGDVVQLARAVSENLAEPDAVRSMAEDFTRLAELEPGGRGGYPRVDEMVARVAALPVLLDLVAEYESEKRAQGFVEFSDQVSLAHQAATSADVVAESVRDRHRVVLLDEYQDTSVMQARLLSTLFAGRAVMAVGDPNQAIYGWRGASAASLAQFDEQFAPDDARRSVNHFTLSTSWRNGAEILDVANALVGSATATAAVPVVRLGARESAPPADVGVEMHETLAEEAESVAVWFAEIMTPSHASDASAPDAQTVPSAALLLRSRTRQEAFLSALRRHDVPYHVLGVGGLLAEPEIADLVSALTVVHDPLAGSELVRLLAGSRWRVGVRDLRSLRDLARALGARFRAAEAAGDADRRSVPDGDDEAASLVDALDFVATVPDDHALLSGFTREALSRLRDAGRFFADVRGEAHGDLIDLVTRTYEGLLLDVESLANETRATHSAGLDAFYDAVGDYLAVAERAELGGFLRWLRQAASRDRLAPRSEEPEPGTVQVLTIHGAKGLEWDCVAVPRLVEGDLPSTQGADASGWVRFGALPYEFRGDADVLPTFDWREATTRKETLDLYDTFKKAVGRRHVEEERRLAYVAVTRARHRLLLSGSFWVPGNVKPHSASRFVTQLHDGADSADDEHVEAGVDAERPLTGDFAHETDLDENPDDGTGEIALWPPDPLGSRRPRVERAAQLVSRADPRAETRYEEHLAALLAEREADRTSDQRIRVPRRIPASAFHRFVTEPETTALNLRRPVPQQPHRRTRLGTRFHAWVEERYSVGGTAVTLDATEFEGVDEHRTAEDEHLERLQANFSRSPWAESTPVDVEREIHLPLDDSVVVCKIDAVFAAPGGFQIVDWKTGALPKGADDLEARQLQLALYRVAYARWRRIDPERVTALFYFVDDDEVIEPRDLPGEDRLRALWARAVSS